MGACVQRLDPFSADFPVYKEEAGLEVEYLGLEPMTREDAGAKSRSLVHYIMVPAPLYSIYL